MVRHNPELSYDVRSTIDAVAASMARQIEHALIENAREIDRRFNANQLEKICDMLRFKVEKWIASREYQENPKREEPWFVVDRLGEEEYGIIRAPSQREAARMYASYIEEGFGSFEEAWEAVREDLANGNLVIVEAQFVEE